MEQPWNWNWNQREGGGYAMGEICCHAADCLDVVQQASMTTDLPREEVDGALLMELMEDLPSSDLLLDVDGDGDVDRQLSHVIRSLEAEIGGGGGGGGEAVPVVVMAADDGGDESLDRIEDLFPDDMDDDACEGASSSFGYWPQVSSSSSSFAGHAGDEAEEGWCVYTDTSNGYGYEGGGVLGYDTVDHHYYYACAEASADHMYLPLWE